MKARRAARFGTLLSVLALYLLPTHGSAQHGALSTQADLKLDTVAVGPQSFIAAHGQRALIQGYASNRLEIWAYPFQILSGYRVAFHSQDSTTTVEGQQIISRVTYRPDSITRIYIGADFVVEEKLFVPLDLPGAILTYSVHSHHPLQIEVHAVPVLDLMWPAGLGGQSAGWNASLPGFVLSEPGYGISATVGSPQIVAHDEIGNRTVHGLAEMGLGFTLRPDKDGAANVFVTLNPAHAADKGVLLRQLMRDQKTLELDSAAQLRAFRESVLRVETPDDEVNRAIAWSEVALHQAWVCSTDLGCGFVAGYGPSRYARRPQYDWFFAGDGLIATDASATDGDVVHARKELEFILRYQDKKTGMIWHELSQSAGFLDWTGKYPYMFVHVDITFQFLGTLGRYAAVTGDTAFVREHWQEVQAAYTYCKSVIDPSTGLPRIPADKEGANEQDRMSDDLGLSTSWVRAASAFAELAALTGHTELAKEADAAGQKARASIPARYWSTQENFWISGRTESGAAMRGHWSGPAEALSMHLFKSDHTRLMLDQLASSSFQADWGTRGIGADSPSFEPESYGKGSVSPVGTAAMASAFWSEHRPVTALGMWQALVPWTSLDSLGHIHELLAGNYYHPQVESVPEQTWSSAAFIQVTLDGLLGLDPDPLGRRLTFSPRIPATWHDLSISQLQLGGSSIALTMHRSADSLSLEVENSGEPIKLQFVPELPLGAIIGHAELNHSSIPAKLENYPQETDARITFDVPRGTSQLKLDWRGGLSVITQNAPPLLGAASNGIHMVDVHLEGHTLTVAADVPSSSSSHLQIQTGWKLDHADGATVQAISDRMFELTFAAISKGADPYRRAIATVYLKP